VGAVLYLSPRKIPSRLDRPETLVSRGTPDGDTRGGSSLGARVVPQGVECRQARYFGLSPWPRREAITAMAVDEWTTERHLTPSGWVTGTRTTFGKVTSGGEVPRPADAIETWFEHGYQKSGWGPEEVSHWCMWHDPAVSEKERERLRSQFKSPFMPDSYQASSDNTKPRRTWS
jgi:hypothetical protein